MRAVVLVTALTLATAETMAADIPSQSKIDSVVVFPAGAEIVRSSRLRIAAGEHALLFADLPAQAVPGSIRVEGKASGRLEIGAVDTRRMLVPRADPVQLASERRAIEAEIEKARDERAGIEAEVKAAESQLALIQKLTELPQHPAPGGPQGAAGQPDWGQIFTLIGQRSVEAQRAQLAAQVRLRDIDRRIEDLNKRLAALAPAQDERTEVKVAVAAAEAVDAELTIRYQVANASWLAYYDARLATGARNVAPRLTLVRRASIQQRTGEDWKDVALSLSTTRPGSGSAAPELVAMTVDYEPEAPPAPPPRPRSMSRQMEMSGDVDRLGAPAAAAPAAPAMVAVEERKAQIENAPFQAVYSVPGKLTVMGTGEQKRVQIDEAGIEPVLVVRTVPRIDPKAYLYAKVTMPRTTAFLPGQVSLFRDGTFVGSGRLPLLAPGEEHELGFGADDSVRVRHAVVEEKRSEQGIISSSKADTRSFRISARNLHQRAIGVVVIDQMPVSQHADIKVELTGKLAPTRRDLDDRRGVMAWELKLEPDQEGVVEFGWRVQWPAAKRIQYGR